MLILYRVIIQLTFCVCIVNARLFLLQPQTIVNLLYSRIYMIESKAVHHLSGNNACFVETALGNSYKTLLLLSNL